MNDDKVHIGLIEWFSASRGYGFVSWDIDGVKQKDVFLHYSDLSMEGFKTVYKNQRVSFQIGQNIRGEPKAICVTVLHN